MMSLAAETQKLSSTWQRPACILRLVTWGTRRSHVAENMSPASGKRLHVIPGGGQISTDPAAAVPVGQLCTQLHLCDGYATGHLQRPARLGLQGEVRSSL